MEEYRRSFPQFSQCGLNCGLCPRYHTDGASRCPGCGGEAFFTKRPSCGVISCSRKRGEAEYCYQCGEYPCKRLEGAELVDSFITHRHMRSDFEKAGSVGIEAYRAELNEKIRLLEKLLQAYNDGRRKSFYCLAVNLLELQDGQQVMAQLAALSAGMDVKNRAKEAVALFQAMAEKRGVVLKLHKK